MQRRDPTRMFLWITFLFLAMVWYSVVKDAAFRQEGRLIPFTVLMLVHGYMHGSIGRWQSRLKTPIYLTAQTVLAVGLVVMAGGAPLAAALFFPLAGEVFGLYAALVPRMLALGALVAAWAVTLLLTVGWQAARLEVPSAVIAMVFVGVYVTLFTQQMRERERAEKLAARLEEANARLREYAAKVEELTITEERQRMARELHDTLAQGLAGLIMQLEAVDDLLARGDAERARTIAARAMQRARSTLQEARTAIQALRSPLEQGDVVEAIRRLVDNLSSDTGVVCAFEAGPGDLHITGPAAEQIYRVAQEGLANIARHAHAGRAWVKLSATGSAIDLEIADDGAGFDPEAAAGAPGHYGLTGLRERIRLAGGSLRIESQPGAGTRLRASLPTTPPPLEG